MYELIVFDWDGTLMDSEQTIVYCLQQAATDLGYPVPEAAQARDVIGLGLNQAVARLFPDLDAQQVQALADQYRRHFLNQDRPASPLFEGARGLLETLAARDHFLAVATGKSRRGLDMELKSSGLGELFHTTRCADETFSKPHPQMLLDILDQLGVDASKTLVVGDTQYDMQMAGNGGSSAVGISHGVHEPERLLEYGALTVVDSLPELADWLSGC